MEGDSVANSSYNQAANCRDRDILIGNNTVTAILRPRSRGCCTQHC